MVEIISTSLEGKIKDFGPIHFTKAEWWAESPKFVLLRYSLRGREAELGVRLDLDKKAFLDDVDEEEQVSAIRNSAPDIWQAVVKEAEKGSFRALALAIAD